MEMCDRHAGVGADGLIIFDPKGTIVSMRLFNSDGSVAELSGNGTRCAAALTPRRRRHIRKRRRRSIRFRRQEHRPLRVGGHLQQPRLGGYAARGPERGWQGGPRVAQCFQRLHGGLADGRHGHGGRDPARAIRVLRRGVGDDDGGDDAAGRGPGGRQARSGGRPGAWIIGCVAGHAVPFRHAR